MSWPLFLLVLCTGGIQVSNSQCASGNTGPVNGVCSPCGAGTYLYRQNDDTLQQLLQANPPQIVSDAKDWNASASRFDSVCGGQTCAGNTGSLEAGVVNTGTLLNNGASVPVTYVGGNTTARMQWGAGSIPEAFTICSVTRYSGGHRLRILNCLGNPSGSRNWLHGHWNNYTGSNFYDGDFHANLHYSIPINTDWVAMCGSNSANTNGLGVVVNGAMKSNGRGGIGSCALGINYNEPSDFQFSKLYVWNKHLSDQDFKAVSLSLYSELFTKSTSNGVCLPCQTNSQSGSAATACDCNPGYTGENGWRCNPCNANTFKSEVGPGSCTACPVNMQSVPGSTVCKCNPGYVGPDGGPCTIPVCPAGKYPSAPHYSVCSATAVVPKQWRSWCSSGSHCNYPGCNTLGSNYGCWLHGVNGWWWGLANYCWQGSRANAGGHCPSPPPCIDGCYDCPENSFSAVGVKSQLDCKCNKGSTGKDGHSCSLCTAGKYKNSMGSAECTSCPSDKPYSTIGATSISMCTQCNSTQVSIAGSRECTTCPSGKYKPTGAVTCANCKIGHFCLGGQAISCDEKSNLQNCTCNAGYMGMDGATCTECPSGSYKDSSGSQECSLCPAGTYGNGTGSISIFSCRRCKRSTYNEIMGAGSSNLCLPCAFGKFHRKLGSRSRDDCKDCECPI